MNLFFCPSFFCIRVLLVKHVEAAVDSCVSMEKDKQSNQIIKDPAGLFPCSQAFTSLTAD